MCTELKDNSPAVTDNLDRKADHSISCGLCKVCDLVFLDQGEVAHKGRGKGGDDAVGLVGCEF